MMHLISAWYNPNRPWYSTDRIKIKSVAESHAEDTINQLKTFRQSDEPVKVLVLKYAPNLRRFLHSQGIFGAAYWSLFDDLQGLSDNYTKPVKYLDGEWPDGASFHYNPFLITVMQEGKVYARIYLAHDGTVTSIKYVVDGLPTLERIFDDRGFLSSVLIFEADGSESTQYYYSESGDLLFSEDIPTGRILVVGNSPALQRDQYDSWDQLIEEQLARYFTDHALVDDTVVIALSEQHNSIVQNCISNQKVVLSYLADRNPGISKKLIEKAAVIFTTTQVPPEMEAELKTQWNNLPQLTLYPFESRDTFGQSANEHIVYISVFADNLSIDELDSIIAHTAIHLVQNSDSRLLICTYKSQDMDYMRALHNLVSNYQKLDVKFLTDQDPLLALGADLGLLGKPEDIIQLTSIRTDAEMISTLAKSRVLLDCGPQVDFALAVEAVNAGVPQINRVSQELAVHQLNGFVITDDDQIPDALDYFLSGLTHWDQSLVQCSVLHDIFRPSEIIERWKLIKAGVNGENTADR